MNESTIDNFRVLKAKLYPNSAQIDRLEKYIEISRRIYNLAVEHREYAIAPSGRLINYYDQTAQLTKQRKIDKNLAAVPLEIERDGLRRADSAFKHFYRRCRNGEKQKGFPRYKSAVRYNSFTIADCGEIRIDGRIRISGVLKNVRCRGLRPVDGKCRRLTIVRRGRSWFARVLVSVSEPPPPPRLSHRAVGIDVGLSSFIATSDGLMVVNPKNYCRLQGRMRVASRRASRRIHGSNRRKRAVLLLRSIHSKISECRSDFTHKLSKQIISDYDLIAVEDLRICNLVRNRIFSKRISDCAWGQFIFRLSYKAERAGAKFVKVNSHNTSQSCSGCGRIVRKNLSERVHKCDCGLVLDRDVNAARNILQRANFLAPGSGNDSVIDAENEPLHPPPMVVVSSFDEASSPV